MRWGWICTFEWLSVCLNPVFLFQVGIVSYGEQVIHNVNLSQFNNTQSLLDKVMNLEQQQGVRTMTFLGIDTARCSTRLWSCSVYKKCTSFNWVQLNLVFHSVKCVYFLYSVWSELKMIYDIQERGLHGGARGAARGQEGHDNRDGWRVTWLA